MLDLFRAGGHLVAGAAVDDRDLPATHAHGRARTVHGDVATAEDRHLAASRRRGVVVGKGIGLHEIDAGEVLVGREDVAQVLAGELHKDRQSRAGAHEHRFVARGEELVDGIQPAHYRIELDLDPEPPQVVDLRLHDGLGQTELRDPVDQDPSGFV